MDPLTQGLLGAATAQLGFRQRLGGATTWIAAITAMLADLDVAIGPVVRLVGGNVDDFAMLRNHRALSHSLLAVPVIALLTALPWWLRRRRKAALAEANKPPYPVVDNATHPEVASEIAAAIAAERPAPKPRFIAFYACCLLAAASHPLLDLCTTYGTQVLSPFTSARYALDAMPIIDIIYTPILIVTLVTCWLVRRFRSSSAVRATLAVGWLGMLLSVGYIGAGYAIGRMARQQAVELTIADGIPRSEIREAHAYPYIGTIFLWRTTVRTDDAWYVARLRPLRSAAPAADDRQIASVGTHLLIAKARKLPRVQTYEWFAAGQIRAEYTRDGGRHVVTFHDMRYGETISDINSMWPTEVVFDRNGKVVEIKRIHRYRGAGRPAMIRRIWEEIHR